MAVLKVMSAGAVQGMVSPLAAEFEQATGHKLDLSFGTAGSLRDRLAKGEAADLVLMPATGIEALEKAGKLVPGSRRDIADGVTGVVVRAGAPKPDISTPEAFKQALLAARAVSYSNPKAGGSSGTFFVGLLDRLGIAAEVTPKAVLGDRGYEVARAVADGRAEIGTTFISEMLTETGIDVVGPLPGDLYNANTYTAGIPAGSAQVDLARAFVAALTDPATKPRWQAAGLVPLF